MLSTCSYTHLIPRESCSEDSAIDGAVQILGMYRLNAAYGRGDWHMLQIPCGGGSVEA